MYGAILGDIIGSPYEFDRGNKSKEFPFFPGECGFTDDTVMTIAVAEALLDAGKNAEADTIRKELIKKMQYWGEKYPNAGYGARFFWWLKEKNPRPYGSFGNGSAMRVSSAGWLYDTIERTREVAAITASVSHNHPEGVKGAEAIASAIFLARNGSDKEKIKEYITSQFAYDLSRTCDEIRPGYYHVESCQQTVPEAITAFLEGRDFEDVIRNAVSLGGDCDTLTDIAAAMAEAFYGVPAVLKTECRDRIPEDMNQVLDRFDRVLGRKETKTEADSEIEKNTRIEKYIEDFAEKPTTENMMNILGLLHQRMTENGQIYVQAETSSDLEDIFDATRILRGETTIREESADRVDTVDRVDTADRVDTVDRVDTADRGEDIRLHLCTVVSDDGNEFLSVYTRPQEAYKDPDGNTIFNQNIRRILEAVLPVDSLKGIVFNPFGKHLVLTKEIIRMLLEVDTEERKCRNDKEGA